MIDEQDGQERNIEKKEFKLIKKKFNSQCLFI